MEEMIARIEGILEQMNARINHLEMDIEGLRMADESIRAELRALEERLRTEIKTIKESLRAEIKTLSEKIDRNFRWTLAILLGVLIPMWVTIILAIILA